MNPYDWLHSKDERISFRELGQWIQMSREQQGNLLHILRGVGKQQSTDGIHFLPWVMENINPSVLASAHCVVMNTFKGTINVKLLFPGLKSDFRAQWHWRVKHMGSCTISEAVCCCLPTVEAWLQLRKVNVRFLLHEVVMGQVTPWVLEIFFVITIPPMSILTFIDLPLMLLCLSNWQWH